MDQAISDNAAEEIAVVPGKRLKATVASLFVAGGDSFVTAASDALVMGYDGIEGDHHFGLTRGSGGREPWYPHGTEMRNERQVSIICPDELAGVARDMGIAELKPEWIGANVALAGVPRLSMLPPRTLMLFEGGVTLKVDGQNAPCRLAGGSVAEWAGMAEPQSAALDFKKAAERRRGLVAWVEKPGRIETGEAVTLRLPEQWIYSA